LEVLAISTLNGLLYGLLLFMLSSGLTLIFSMMGVLNFAHASFYMLGAYLAYGVGALTGFWAALFLSPVIVGLIGAGVERFGLRRVHAQGHVAELLFTFGLAFLIEEIVKLVWGRQAVPYKAPSVLAQPIFSLYGTTYPAFRVFMMAIALAMLVGLWLLLKRTRVGLMVRAALTHPHMVGHLGHNVPLLFTLVFGTGCAMAALAGVIGGALFVTEPSMALALGPIVFVVVVVGGLGSLAGAFVASLVIGLMQTFAVAIDASLGDVFLRLGLPAPRARPRA
jgi:branched-chain amino acid transport system permease protein